MKYIRTKNGIYDIENSEEHFFTGLRRKSPFAIDYEANPQDCKTTDTIEELCDEFVNEKVILSKNDIKDILKYDKECLKTEIIYGAIWTDKGLIYVAKMNEKGELELL